MAEQRVSSGVYWIDHYVVPTNDLASWVDWAVHVLGAEAHLMGLTTQGRKQGVPLACFAHFPYCHIGAFLQNEMLPPSKGLGKGLPRYGFFIRPEDVDEHLQRLDERGVPHTDPILTSDEGEEGAAICFQDPDGNQCEFWAPARLPEGAMAGSGPLKVGRLSHGVFESRDLAKTAEFFTTFCDVQPIEDDDIPEDTLALRLAGGGRLVFKKVEQLELRTGGAARWRGPHNALLVRDEDFMPLYQRMWARLSEWEEDFRTGEVTGDVTQLPARTGVHGSQAGRRWKELYGRGDQFYDWDTNSFHLVGGLPIDGSLAIYQGRYMEDYAEELARSRA